MENIIDDEDAGMAALPDWTQHRDMIYHLLRCSDRTLLVLSKHETWLDNFGRHCVQQAPSDLKLTVLSAAKARHPSEILPELCRRFGVTVAIDANFEQQIVALQQGLKGRTYKPVLVIEHADRWHNDQIISLFRILQRHTENPVWRCLIVAHQSLEQTLQQAALQSYVEQQCHLLKLEPQENISVSRTQSQENFAMVRERSSGILKDYLLAFDGWIKGVPFSWVLGSGIVLMLLLIIGMQVIFSPGKNQAGELSNVASQISSNSMLESDHNASVVAAFSSLDDDVAEASNQEFFAPRTVTSIDLAVAAPTETTVQEKIAAPITTAKVEVAQTVNQEPATASTKTTSPVATKSTMAVIDREVAAVAKTASLSLMEKNLLAMESKHYTIQLLGSSNETAVQDFVKRANLQHAWYVKTTRDNKAWYVLYHGDFADRKAANDAISELPANLRKLKPWLRQLGDVQQLVAARAQ